MDLASAQPIRFYRPDYRIKTPEMRSPEYVQMSGRVAEFGVPPEVLEHVIASGKPFRTSGCPGKEDDVSASNRPYGDSSPTDILSFPFAPAKRDLRKIRRQMAGEGVRVGR